MSDERTKPYTVTELASAAGVSDSYVRRLLRDGKLTGDVFGKTWLIPADVGLAWLKQRRERWEKF